jgi:DNA-binding XRE family transcriptional regulator
MATATHRAATEPRCRNCQTSAARVDQAGWCEQCVVDLGNEAGLLYNVEELIREWLQRGYQPEHLRSAVEMSLAQASGTIPGSLLTREAVDLPSQRGDWKVPQSAFNRTGPTRNRISELRHAMGMSLEQVAHCIGVELATVALWEQDGLPAEEDMPAVFAMCDLFGFPGMQFVFGLESGDVA